jgi:DNA-directed RNA polymerase specialized sigma24 family protein
MSGPITDALDRLKKGDPNAPFDLQRELQPFLLEMIRLVQRRRVALLNARIDSHAIVNDALHSFLTGIPKGEFPALSNHEEVKKALTSLVTRTLCDQIRWHRRKKRDVGLEQQGGGIPLEAIPDAKELAATAGDLACDLASWLDQLRAFVRDVHPKAIDIIELSLQGLDNNDIAAVLSLAVRTVQKIKQDMFLAWKKAATREDEHGSHRDSLAQPGR